MILFIPCSSPFDLLLKKLPVRDQNVKVRAWVNLVNSRAVVTHTSVTGHHTPALGGDGKNFGLGVWGHGFLSLL